MAAPKMSIFELLNAARDIYACGVRGKDQSEALRTVRLLVEGAPNV